MLQLLHERIGWLSNHQLTWANVYLNTLPSPHLEIVPRQPSSADTTLNMEWVLMQATPHATLLHSSQPSCIDHWDAFRIEKGEGWTRVAVYEMPLHVLRGVTEKESRQGQFVVVLDQEDRENEGDLILAAEDMTPEKMALLIRLTSGVICVPMLPKDLDRLEIPLMTEQNTESHQTAFTLSLDLNPLRDPSMTTGISAQDRCQTIRRLADPLNHASDFVRPGHVFPLRARVGGVLERPGHTEAALDLCRLTGKQPVGVISELMNPDGSMARRQDVMLLARLYGFHVITIPGLQVYMREQLELQR